LDEIWETIKTVDIREPQRESSTIGTTGWVSNKIDWDNSILYGTEASYCWVHVDVERLFSGYPLPPDLPIIQAKKLGESYIIDRKLLEDAPRVERRGRPTRAPWDDFHVKVALLIKKSGLPKKKESMILDLENWFRSRGHIVSRSAIHQKLMAYYQKFSDF
jgi:hypothetical protein